MKLEIPIKVDIDDMENLIEDLGHLQTCKLFEGADQILVDVDDVIEVLKNHTEVQRKERKTGNWVGIDDEPCETFECDRCGFVLEDWIQGAFYNFCPNCGADMRGEQE